jgi:CheY-like chemotaxis protein
MDVKMPGMDGYEATAVLKGDPATAVIPIIALTAHAMQEDRDRAVAAGVNGYETKPVDFAKLLEKVNALLAAVPA